MSFKYSSVKDPREETTVEKNRKDERRTATSFCSRAARLFPYNNNNNNMARQRQVGP